MTGGGARAAGADEAPAARSAGALVYGALTVQTLISAGTYLAAKRAMVELPPFEVVQLRFALSGLLFAALLLFVRGPALPPRSAWGRIVFCGFLAGPLNQGFFFYGLSRSVPAHGALLYALTPLGVYLYMLARARERASRRRLVGILIAFSGVLVLLLGRGMAAAWGPLLGDLFILVAVAAWVLYTAEGMPLIREHGAFRASAWTMAAGALLLAPAFPLVVDPARVAAASATAIANVVYLGVMTSVISYLLWFYALSRLEASKASVFANLQPPATAVAAWLILGDPITWEILAGGALVLVGVRIAQRT